METAENGKLPKVSVIIPSRNEGPTIGDCLKSILENDYPQDCLEILVVDGMSEDGTRERVREWMDRNGSIRLLENPKRIVPTALNIGIQNCTGQVVLRADAHTIFEKTYIKECVNVLKEENCDNAGGPMRVVAKDRFGKAVGFATSTFFGVGDSAFHFEGKEGYTDTVYLGAYPKEVFQKIGYFDEEFVRNQDDEFNFRLREAGGKIYLSPRIRSYYSPRSGLLSLWRQYFQYGFWKVRVAEKHQTMMKWRHFIPCLFVILLAFFGFIGFFHVAFLIFFLSLIGVYVGVSLLFSLKVALARGISYLALLPLVYACLHLAYGTGFGWGLVKSCLHPIASVVDFRHDRRTQAKS